MIFEADEKTLKLIGELRGPLGAKSDEEVIRKALALANVASRIAGTDHTVTLARTDDSTTKPVQVSLAG